MRSTPDETISAARLAPTASTEPDPAPAAERGVGAFASGEVIAERYQVVRALGRGGMGEVYEAVDRELGQTVAIKLLRPEIAQSAAARERMLDELRLARRIAHPAVCRVFDIFRHSATGSAGAEDLLGIAMEYLPGESLAARLGRPFARAEAERWLADVADALTAAHACGVVHLDLKPGNVLMVDHGGETRAVLADFGVSRAVAAAGGRASGGTPGTPDFIAPELARGAPATPAADVYSLGVLLERVAGAAVLATADAPSGWTPRQLRAWRRIAAACRSDDPRHRPSSPSRVALALSSSRRRRTSWGIALASVAAVAVVAASYEAWARSRREASFRSTIGAAETALAQQKVELARSGCASAVRAANGLSRQARLRAEACLAEASGELAGAARDYRALWALSPGDVDLAIALARLEGRLGRGREALAVLAAVPRPQPAAIAARLGLAEAEAASVAQAPDRQADAARRVRESLGAGGGVSASWADLLLAEALVRVGRTDEAEVLLDDLDRRFAFAREVSGAIRLELARGDLLRRRGERDDAATRYEHAAGAAARAGMVALQARALRRGAYSALERGRPDEANLAALAALEALRPTQEEYEVALTEALLGRIGADGADHAGARARLEAALAALERLGADATGDIAFQLAQIDWNDGLLVAARERFATAAASRARGGDLAEEVLALGLLAWVELDSGDVPGAASTSAGALLKAADVASAEIRARALATEALIRCELDDLDEARRLSEEAFAILDASEPRRVIALLLSVQAAVAQARGAEPDRLRLMRAALAVAEATEWPESVALGHTNLAELWLDRGDAAAAKAALAAARAQEVPETPFTRIVLGRAAARLRAAEGDVAGALVDLEHLRRRSAEAGFEIFQGEIELTLGELLHVSGRMADAGEVAESLIERASRRGQARLARLASEQRDRLREAAKAKEPTSMTRARRRRPPPARPAASS